MSESKMREEFEAWATSCGMGIGKDHAGFYGTDVIRMSWAAWQASRESLVIELPKPDDFFLPDLAEPIIADCAATITAVGLKVSK